MRPKLSQVSNLNSEIEAFIESNRSEVISRYNRLLPEINNAQGHGIMSIHNRHFGSKGLYFGAAVQYLFRTNKGQPIHLESALENSPSNLENRQSTHDAAIKASKPEDADDNDASDFIARHAS